MDKVINDVLSDMEEYLSVQQMRKLQEVLVSRIMGEKAVSFPDENELDRFLTAKTIEGCSARTVKFYKDTNLRMLSVINKPLRQITTEDIREYLVKYQSINNCSKTTIDNKKIPKGTFSRIVICS